MHQSSIAANTCPQTPSQRTDPKRPIFASPPSEAQGARVHRYNPYWTADEKRGRRLAAEIDAGNVFVNGLVKSDPRLPFGGVRDSGFGRELGRDGALAFVNRKTVWIG